MATNSTFANMLGKKSVSKKPMDADDMAVPEPGEGSAQEEAMDKLEPKVQGVKRPTHGKVKTKSSYMGMLKKK